MYSFSKNGFTVEVTSTGLIITKGAGTPVIVDVPHYGDLGIDPTVTSTWHQYVVVNKLSNISGIGDPSLLWTNLKEQPYSMLRFV